MECMSNPKGTALQPRQRSPKMIQRAVREYGEELTDLRYEVFAKAMAEGATQREAFQRISPGSSKATAKVQGSVLAAHPDMAAMIARHYLGVSVVSRAAALRAFEIIYQLATSSSDINDKTRLEACNSVLDRSGLPRSSQVAINAYTVAHSIIERMSEPVDGEDSASVIDVEVIERSQRAESTDPDDAGEDHTSMIDPREAALEKRRAELAYLMPAAYDE